MNTVSKIYMSFVDMAENMATPVLTTLARFTFAATLLGYFWASALTKVGDGFFGVFSPSFGAYAQIFPKLMEAISYDVSQLSLWHSIVVIAGTLAEFVLPLLIVIGLFTRLSAVAMIGFIAVQTLTDLFGHGAIEHSETLGTWFDRIPDSLILDQRLFWMLILVTLITKGAGPLSVDRLVGVK
jgi:putative oxidoreductase